MNIKSHKTMANIEVKSLSECDVCGHEREMVIIANLEYIMCHFCDNGIACSNDNCETCKKFTLESKGDFVYGNYVSEGGRILCTNANSVFVFHCMKCTNQILSTPHQHYMNKYLCPSCVVNWFESKMNHQKDTHIQIKNRYRIIENQIFCKLKNTSYNPSSLYEICQKFKHQQSSNKRQRTE